MYDIRVHFNVGRDEVAAAIYRKWLQYYTSADEVDDPGLQELPTSRTAVWAAIDQLFINDGSPSCGFWDEATETQTEMSYDLADKFFPELKDGKHG